MSKSKTHGKDKKKAAQLVLRVEKAERDAFVALCERLDTTAAREIRRFMREMVATNAEAPETPAPKAEPVLESEDVAPAPAPKQSKKAAAAASSDAPHELTPDAPAEAEPSAIPATKRRKKPGA